VGAHSERTGLKVRDTAPCPQPGHATSEARAQGFSLPAYLGYHNFLLEAFSDRMPLAAVGSPLTSGWRLGCHDSPASVCLSQLLASAATPHLGHAPRPCANIVLWDTLALACPDQRHRLRALQGACGSDACAASQTWIALAFQHALILFSHAMHVWPLSQRRGR
jgi:hypothetical protein